MSDCMSITRRLLGVALLAASLTSASAAHGQDSARATASAQADSFAGAWESKSRNTAYAGTLYLRMELKQMGDSVWGSAVLENADRSSEAPLDIGGSINHGKLKLTGRFGVFQLEGTLRKGKIEARVIPGRAAEQNAFSATFTRMR